MNSLVLHDNTQSEGRKEVMVRMSKIPKGRVTIRKVSGGYIISINGRRFEEAGDKATAMSKAARIRRLRK